MIKFFKAEKISEREKQIRNLEKRFLKLKKSIDITDQDSVDRVAEAQLNLISLKIADIRVNVSGFEEEWEEFCAPLKEVENGSEEKGLWSERVALVSKMKVRFADRWARLMQYEMQKQGTGLTKEIVMETQKLADVHWIADNDVGAFSRSALYKYWYLGVELAKYLSSDASVPEKVQGWRNDLILQKQANKAQANSR